MLGGLRAGVAGRLKALLVVLATCAAVVLVVGAGSASATVEGNFCEEVFLSSGATCHSTHNHIFFEDVEGGSNFQYPTCVGIDVSPSGGNQVNVCSSHGVSCISACRGFNGYAYVHNHGTIGDYYDAFLRAAS